MQRVWVCASNRVALDRSTWWSDKSPCSVSAKAAYISTLKDTVVIPEVMIQGPTHLLNVGIVSLSVFHHLLYFLLFSSLPVLVYLT